MLYAAKFNAVFNLILVQLLSEPNPATNNPNDYDENDYASTKLSSMELL